MTQADWPFADPPDTEVITLERILRGESPVRLVTHDADDGAWQLLDGGHVFEEDAVLVLLGEMVQFEPALRALADLPRGWYAWRSDAEAPWQTRSGEPPAAHEAPG